jgi:hypothetical protein
VEGIPPRPEAYRDFHPQSALDHKTFYRDDAAYRADMDRINKERHDGMSQPLKEMIGNDNTLKAAEAFRREVTPDSMGVFADEKPVDSTLLTAFTDKLNNLRDTFSKRKGIMSILNDVHSTLFDADGNPEVLPSKLQGVRDNMTDWLAKKHGTTNESKDVQAASAALTGLVEDLNPVMNSGAPKWDLWRQEWASRSRPINRQEFLQDYDVGRPKSLWDQTGKLIPRKLQALVADIANAHSDKPVHDAHSLTDAEVQQIVNTRNELATEDFARMQAEVGGSPTSQLLANSLKRGSGVAAQTLKRGVEAGLHATGIMTANPLINAGVGAWQISAPARAARAVAKQQATLTEQTNALKQNLLSQRGTPLSGGGGP